MSLSPPLILAGMHRSGTSLVASYLQDLGVNMGEDLIEADENNPHGYFEAKDFVSLHGRLLSEATRDDDGGHPDWGWTHSEWLSSSVTESYRDRATKVAESRAGLPLWGWKDPRTTVLLDFWDEILDDARYVFLYRFPWDVADSMQRLGADVFLDNPDYAYRIWTYYNRRILRFKERNPDRVVLAATRTAMDRPQELVSLLRGRLGLPLEAAGSPFLDKSLFRSRSGDDPLIYWVAQRWPEAIDLLRRLDRAADLSLDGLWSVQARPFGRLVTGRSKGESSKPESSSKPAALQPRYPPQPRNHRVDISVITPCHNDGDYLIEALASVERALRKDSSLICELIVVNDGSSDPNTLAILETVRELGIEVVDLKPGGLARARNEGIRRARGDYMLPLDADNRLLAGWLEDAVRFLNENPDYAVLYGDRSDFGLRNGRFVTSDLDFDRLLQGNYIDACALIRKQAVLDQCGYDEGLAVWEDWDLWIRFARSGLKFRYEPRLTFDYRARPTSLSSQLKNVDVRRSSMLKILDKHESCYAELLTRTTGHLPAAWPALLKERHQADLTRLDELQAAYRRLESLLDVLRAKAERLETIEADSQAQMQRIEDLEIVEGEFESLEQSYRRLSDRSIHEARRLERLEADYRSLERRGTQKEQELARLEAEYRRLEQRSTQKELELSHLEEEYRRLQEVSSGLSRKAEYLQELELAYEHLESHVRDASIRQARPPRFRGTGIVKGLRSLLGLALRSGRSYGS